MNLVIIEGAGKKDTIKKYLGSDYEVVASKGHIRDLPIKKFGVNLINNYEPEYEILSDKREIVKTLKEKALKADKILLATDPDREGEAISWHLAHILGLNINDNIRIVFNEISKSAVTAALESPRGIDLKLVDAQQARRVLDRIVGYKLSPIICNKIQPKLSAGRVQSVALKLVVDREKQIRNFKPEEFWSCVATLHKNNQKEIFKASITKFNGKKLVISNEKEMNDIIAVLKSGNYIVKSIKKSVGKTRPQPPYTTSTMQQDALNKLGFSLKKATSVAQELYEGVNIIGEGKTALVTYIRTDSVRVSPSAQQQAKNFIINKFGVKYYPKNVNVYKSKSSAQDAHEAIRPISLDKTPESLKTKLSTDSYKLYKLIYDRFLASQMCNATYNSVVVEIDNNKYTFKASGKTPTFDGFMAVYNYEKSTKKPSKSNDEDSDAEIINDKLPPLEEGEIVELNNLDTKQKFTKPPARYTEASLVKEMEEKGIGRPATYTPTITTLASRNYTDKDGKALLPTELGEKVVELLEKYFKEVINVEFTANMEDTLDLITQKDIEWQSVIDDFYKKFEKMLKHAGGDTAKFKVPPKESDETCEKCGSKMLIRTGKYGEFLACSNFPACKNIRSIKKVVAKCPECGKDVLEKTSKRGTIFYGCSDYPTCKFVSWDKPLNQRCEKCNSFLVEKFAGGRRRVKCSNSSCDYILPSPARYDDKSLNVNKN